MSQIERTLEEERRIINAATAGPWEWRDDQYPGQLIRRVYLGDPTSDDWMKRGEVHPMNVLKCGDWLPTDGDAEFIAHARAALPLRNAQVEAVLSIHRPVEVEPSATICSGCSTRRGTFPDFRYFPVVEYPCETVRAIEGAGA